MSTLCVVGLTASSFGMGATLSNYFGQLLVEKFGHVVALSASMWLSVVPIALFGSLMPETLGQRGTEKTAAQTLNSLPENADSYRAIV